MFKLIAKILYTILLIIETFVAIRFVFVFINANRDNQFVNFIFRISDIFVSPFRGIIPTTVNLGVFTVDTTALLAIIVYMVIAFILVEFIGTFSSHTESKS